MEMNFIKDSLEMAYYLIAIGGIPLAFYKYRQAKQREKIEKDEIAYDSLDEKYLSFLNLCLDNIELDIFDLSDSQIQGNDHVKFKKELIIFTQLFSIFERAFRTLYNENKNERKIIQWEGWKQYMIDFCSRENFQKAWDVSGKTFDARFQEYIDDLISKERPKNKKY